MKINCVGYLVTIEGKHEFFKESHPVLLLLHRNEARDKDKLNTSWLLITGELLATGWTISIQ